LTLVTPMIIMAIIVLLGIVLAAVKISSR